MKSNALLKFLIPVVVLVFFAIIFMSGGKDPKKAADDTAGLALTDEEAKALGIEGDTAQDTLRTLVGELKNVRNEVNAVREQNKKLVGENQRLQERDQSIESRIANAVNRATEKTQKEVEAAREETAKVSDQARNLLGQLQDKVKGVGGSLGSNNELPVGLGLSPGDGNGFSGSGGGQMIWIEPSDAVPVDPRGNNKKSGFTFPNAFSNPLDGSALDRGQKQLRATYKGERDLDRNVKRSDDNKAVYTIAENSTLIGSTTMTALIGRVPIDGTVNDPYPFKVLIGKDNLAANGIELPNVSGAVMSGTATGDWTLSCVRGQVESITFVFDDGTIRTVPEPEAVVNRSQSRNTTGNVDKIRGGIGYISDKHGIPCISGDKKSNAKEYIGNASLITAAGAAVASAFSKDDKGSSNGSYGGSGNNIVSDRNQAFNNILTSGVEDIRDWMNKLYGEAFAAVYVPPHQEIAVHIDHELTIDYEPHGRKVIQDDADSHTTSLD